MRKFILLTIFFSASVILCQNIQMYVFKNDGTVQIYSIGNINDITFSGIPSSIKELENITSIIKSFEVFQNYPNPFNPSTIIEYSLPNSGFVSIKIFNINGELIRKLFSGEQKTGLQRIGWDSKDDNGNMVTSGIYVYQIQFNESIISKKMILIK